MRHLKKKTQLVVIENGGFQQKKTGTLAKKTEVNYLEKKTPV